MAKQVTGNNESNDGYERGFEQLPRPQLTFEEKRYGREKRGYDTAEYLGTKVQDNARHKASQTNEQALIGAIALREDSCKAHCGSANELAKPMNIHINRMTLWSWVRRPVRS